jgi:hypothetical protein
VPYHHFKEEEMSMKVTVSTVLVCGTMALTLAVAGCKKEEKAKEVVPATTQQAGSPLSTSGIQDYGFEDGTAGWASADKAIKLEQTSGQKHAGNSSLKVYGTAGAGSWNFAASPRFNLEPGKKYRVSGWIFVESLDKTKNAPLFKCGIYKDGKWTANAFTKLYNLKKMNEWQLVSGEFTTPADGKISGLASLEKGTQEQLNAVIYVDDVRVELAP